MFTHHDWTHPYNRTVTYLLWGAAECDATMVGNWCEQGREQGLEKAGDDAYEIVALCCSALCV